MAEADGYLGRRQRKVRFSLETVSRVNDDFLILLYLCLFSDGPGSSEVIYSSLRLSFTPSDQLLTSTCWCSGQDWTKAKPPSFSFCLYCTVCVYIAFMCYLIHMSCLQKDKLCNISFYMLKSNTWIWKYWYWCLIQYIILIKQAACDTFFVCLVCWLNISSSLFPSCTLSVPAGPFLAVLGPIFSNNSFPG